MKLRQFLFACFVGLSLAALPGCSKSSNQQSPDAVDINGVKVDLPKFQKAFENAPQEVLDGERKFLMAFRYGQYENALMELDKLSNAQGLTDDQKKMVATLIDQTKQVMAKAPPR